MIINPSLPSGYSIFSDDIRHELGGKITYVGTYGSVMYINGSLPVVLSKFCITIVYREETTSLEPVTVKVFMPGDDPDEPTGKFELQPQPEMIPPPSEEFMMREARFMFEVPGLVVKEEGSVKVRAYRGDDEFKLGAMMIKVNPEVTPAEVIPAAS